MAPNKDLPPEILSLFDELRDAKLSMNIDALKRLVEEGCTHLDSLRSMPNCNPGYIQGFAARLDYVQELLRMKKLQERHTFRREGSA